MNFAEAPSNTRNKRSLIRTSHVYHRRRAARRNQQVEEYKHTQYTHTHTHTHTQSHTHTCTHTHTAINKFFDENQEKLQTLKKNFYTNSNPI